MEKVGLTELKNSLSSYIDMVTRGQHFLITEHSKPVAKLCPLGETGTSSSLLEVISALSKSKKVQCTAPMHRFDTPFTIKLSDLSASELLIKMRE